MANANGHPFDAAVLPTDLKAEMYATLIVTSKEGHVPCQLKLR